MEKQRHSSRNNHSTIENSERIVKFKIFNNNIIKNNKIQKIIEKKKQKFKNKFF
jgi:hypothetical protein